MATHDEKAYLHCRINLVMELLLEIVQEMEKCKRKCQKIWGMSDAERK